MDSPSTDSVSTRHPLAVLRFLGLVVLGSGVGGVAALAAVGFVNTVVWLNDLLLISPRGQMMAANTTLVTLATLLVPIFGGLLVGQLHRGLPEGRPHTPADVIAAVQTRRGCLPAKAGALSALSGLVSLGAGASVGQYGPLVHLGATLGSLITRLLRLGRSEDNITIACGVAAAIAAAFNAPLAGIVFAHEVVLRHYALRAFAPVAAAAIVGYVLASQLLAQGALFHITEPAIPKPWEFALFLALGGLGALVAGAYIHAILAMGQLAKRLPLPTSLRPALAGALLGLTALWIPDILGMGQETLRFATLPGAYGGGELLLVLLLKLAATALCLGLGFAGGAFSPALVIGTLFGALAGTLVAELGGGQETFIFYAVCGMVAVTAPVLGAPLTTLLIVFELTGSYALTTAALASVTLASPLAAQLFGRSLFDIQLARRGLDLSAGRSRAVLQEERLTELISHDAVTLLPETPLTTAISRLSLAGRSEAYLVDDQGVYHGCVTLASLEALREDSESPTLADCPKAPRPVLDPQSSLWEAMHQLQKITGEAIAVVDEQRRFLGVAYESSIAQAFLHHSDALRREEHGAG